MELTLPLAFIAGLISFISPCVLPLVPAYVGYMGGRLTHTVAISGVEGGQTAASLGVNRRFIIVIHSLFFIAGFTLIFVGFGLLSTAFVSVVGGQNLSTVTNLIGRIGGIVIIFFGLHFMGVLPALLARFRRSDSLLSSPLVSLIALLTGSALVLWAFSGSVFIWDSRLWSDAPWAPQLGLFLLAALVVWFFLGGAFTDPAIFWRNLIDRINNALYADTRRDMASLRPGQGFASSALMGLVFAAGWTPCIGPVYGGILTLALNGGDVGQAGTLLAAYSLGLGVPFLLTALALDRAQSVLRRLQRRMHAIELVSGAFLIVIGLLVASGTLQSLSSYFAQGDFALAAVNLENQVVGAITGQPESTPVPLAEPTPVSSDLIIVNPVTDQSASSQAENAAAPNATPVIVPQGLEGISDLAQLSGPTVGIAEGNIAPGFETVTASGQPIRLADYRGQVVVLNFWATWCGPCRIEMPALETTYRQLKNQGFIVIAVNNAETAADVQGFGQELDLSFPLVLDEHAEIQTRYNIYSYPSTFILNREGIIVQRHYGPLTTEDLNAAVSAAMAS